MCTLIYWAKLVSLLHINIDEGGKKLWRSAWRLLLTQLIPLEVREGESCFK